MDYNFNSSIACVYGVDSAVMIHNMHWWIAKNKAGGEHFYEGKWWTYNSMNAFSELFPFWTEKQIRRIIENLKNDGAIVVGNFNKKGFDRTQWYALSDKITKLYDDEKDFTTSGKTPFAQTGKCIRPNGQMDLPKRANASAQTGAPIPDINTDNINKENIYIKEIIEVLEYLNIKTNSRFSARRVQNTKKLVELFDDEFTVSDIKKVIDKKAIEWKGTDFAKYLRPDTLFGDKFESYLYAEPCKAVCSSSNRQTAEIFEHGYSAEELNGVLTSIDDLDLS